MPTIEWGNSHRHIDKSEIGEGVSHTDGKFVCADCIEDEGVQKFIKDFYAQNPGERGPCSYSQNEQGIHLDWVAEHILNECILPYWQDAIDSGITGAIEDSEFVYPTKQTVDILADGDLGILHDDLLHDLVGALPSNRWVKKPDPSEAD